MGVCCNSVFGAFGIFLAKKSFQSSKFSEGIFFTWPLFSHFVINLENNSSTSGQQNTNHFVALALVPCPPLPAVIVTPALVPCPSASALACRHRRVGSRPLPVSVRPCLPSSSCWLSSLASQHPPSSAVLVAATAPTLAIPLLPSPSRQPPLSSAATIIVATKPSLPPPPLPPISCMLGKVPFHIQRNELPISLKQMSVITTFKKNESG
jgi:hypothetical protein